MLSALLSFRLRRVRRNDLLSRFWLGTQPLRDPPRRFWEVINGRGASADQNSIILPKATFRSFGIAGGVERIAVIQKT